MPKNSPLRAPYFPLGSSLQFFQHLGKTGLVVWPLNVFIYDIKYTKSVAFKLS
jgi:hypothetical protein